MEHLPETPTVDDIKAWALANPVRAGKIGKRLMMHADNKDALRELESLGEDEDKATQWAIDNPMQTRITILGLLPKLLEAIKKIEAEAEAEP